MVGQARGREVPRRVLGDIRRLAAATWIVMVRLLATGGLSKPGSMRSSSRHGLMSQPPLAIASVRLSDIGGGLAVVAGVHTDQLPFVVETSDPRHVAAPFQVRSWLARSASRGGAGPRAG